MKKVLGQLLACALFAAMAAAFWLASVWEARLVRVDEALTTLRYEDAARETLPLEESFLGRRWPWSTAAADQPRVRRAIARFWLSADFSANDDKAVALIAADTAYRASVAAGDRAAIARRLDPVLKQYAEVLRNDPEEVDAAYNYEYVARLRGSLASAKPKDGVVIQPGPSSIHGIQGSPPPETDMTQFKMFVPMSPDERKNVQPDAGKGERKTRKG